MSSDTSQFSGWKGTGKELNVKLIKLLVSLQPFSKYLIKTIVKKKKEKVISG